MTQNSIRTFDNGVKMHKNSVNANRLALNGSGSTLTCFQVLATLEAIVKAKA